MTGSMTIREIILASMARTLWVAAYADEVEERAAEGDEAADSAMARNGADWMVIAPETPDEARTMAAKLCVEVEQLNGRTLEDGFTVALVADLLGRVPSRARSIHRESPVDAADRLADTFGHYLAMQALGHGVSWEDDHAEMPLKLPYFSNGYLRSLVRL